MVNKNKTIKEHWDPGFYKSFPGYKIILSLCQYIEAHFPRAWLTPADYQRLAQCHYHQQSIADNLRVQFCAQDLNMDYLDQIIQYRQVPTRAHSWHDFFNNLTWLVWPKIKWAIVNRYVKRSEQYFDQSGKKQRTRRQNLLAHFDECGMIIVSDNPECFEYITSFQWKKLFLEKRALLQHCLPLLIGHGLLEKALTPYIGMTAKAICLHVSPEFFSFSYDQQIAYVDEAIAHFILSDGFPGSPQALQPFPLLGWPAWHRDNHQENFYNNLSYFREGRRVQRHDANNLRESQAIILKC